MNVEDMGKVRKIHEKYFPEMEFPDFFNGFLCAFTILDDNNQLIVAGGVRLIAELTLLTDQNYSPHARVVALRKALELSSYVCSNTSPNLKQLHIFADGEPWLSQLKKQGFQLMTSKALVWNI
jgi:hypothetical protein